MNTGRLLGSIVLRTPIVSAPQIIDFRLTQAFEVSFRGFKQNALQTHRHASLIRSAAAASCAAIARSRRRSRSAL
jgi:hypothetical protein